MDRKLEGDPQGRHRHLDLVGISFTALFLEMAVIRFVGSTVDVIAYFNNFILLSAFLGLGLGALLVRRFRNLLPAFPMVFLAFVALLVRLDSIDVAYEGVDQVVWFSGLPKVSMPATTAVIVVFVGSMLTFVPLGYGLGANLERYENRLEAYAYDVMGSIVGVAGFAAMSWLRTPAWLWFSISSVVVLLLLRRSGRLLLPVHAGLLMLAVFLSTVPAPGTWSPYYKVRLVPEGITRSGKPPLYTVLVDKQRIQDALDFDSPYVRTALRGWVDYYRLPYLLREPRDVLVIGGGSGNDTVVALRAGAERVDVVEIDPVLVDAGRSVHPQRPYSDPRVRVFADDGRAFLHRTDDKYDFIVMNAVDSHLQLAGLSTLRLESYLYTVEAFQDVRHHMRDSSVFVVHLSSTRPWMGSRLYWSLTKAFGHPPALMETEDSPFGSVAFVYGPPEALRQNRWEDEAALQHLDPGEAIAKREATDLCTDDWPHLYLEGRKIPVIYYYVLGIILLPTLAGFGALALVRRGRDNLHFLLLGAAFMLLETRAITQFALLFGSTWIVNAVVVGSILTVIFGANLLLWKGRRVRRRLVYPVLLTCLVVLYGVPIELVLSLGMAARVLAAAVVVGLPIFFASLIFSESFRRAVDTSTAFGANLVGVVIGGALEYSSMVWGLDFLYLLAAGLYLASWLALARSSTLLRES